MPEANPASYLAFNPCGGFVGVWRRSMHLKMQPLARKSAGFRVR